MKTTLRTTMNKTWEQEKETRKRVERYLKHGGNPVRRASRQRGPNDGAGRPTWYEAGTETLFPEGYRNYAQRREDARQRRKLNRIMRRAKRDPGRALRRFFGEDKR